jgi:hypothetical protein
MRDRTVPRTAGFRILLLVGLFFVLAIVWLTLNPPTDDNPDTIPPAPTARAPETAPPDLPTPEQPLDLPPAPEVQELGDGRFRVGTIEFDENHRTISVPAAVQELRDPVEYVLVSRHGKVHESVFVTDADARNIHVAALLLGMRSQPDLGPANSAATLGDHGVVDAWIEWKINGSAASLPLHESVALADPDTRQPSGTLPGGGWLYNGSGLAGGDFLASQNGSIIAIIRDPSALINNPGSSRDNDDIHTPNAARLPKLRHPVRIVLKVR